MKLLTHIYIMIFVALSAGVFGFELEPIPADINLSKIAKFCYAFGNDTCFKKEPEYKGIRKYGRLNATGQKLVAYASKAKGDIDSIIIDLDENGDVTDDQIIKIGETTRMKLPGLKFDEFIIQLANSKWGLYSIEPTEWYRGEVALGEKNIRAILLDTDLRGLNTDGDDFLLLDMDNDGRFELFQNSRLAFGANVLEKRIIVDGRIWNVELDAVQPDIKLVAYSGDCGAIEIDVEIVDGMAVSQLIASMREYKSKSYQEYSFAEKKASMQISTGRYEKVSFDVVITKGDKDFARLKYKMSDVVVVEKGEARKLALAKGKFAISVSNSKNKLKINARSVETEHGLHLESAELFKKNGKMKSLPAPKVEIRLAESSKVVHIGTMKYG